MVRLARRVVVGTAFALFVSTAAYAQAPGAAARDAYKKGVDAVKAGKWADAITNLQNAIAADGRPRSYKEGVFDNDYFPQYYLFIAYARSNDMPNAAKFSGARNGVPAKIAADSTQASADFKKWQDGNAALNAFNDLMGKGDNALKSNNFDAASGFFDQASKLPGLDDINKKKATDKIAAVGTAKVAEEKRLAEVRDNAARQQEQEKQRLAQQERQKTLDEFNAAKGRGDTAYNQKNWPVAITAYNDAKTKSPQDFNGANLEPKLQDAIKQKQKADDFEAAVKNGEAAFNAKNYPEAKTAYASAQGLIPDEFQKRGLSAKLAAAQKEIDKMGADAAKKAEFTAAMNAGIGAVNAGRYDDAIRQFETARQKSPDDFKSQNLQAKIDDANNRKKAALNAANNTPPKPPVVETIQPPPGVSGDKLAHDGLSALLATGDAAKAIQLLRQAHDAGRFSKSGMKVTVDAYLSVALAAQALQKNDDDLKRQAKQQYKTVPRDYKLDDKLVSPKIRELLGTS